MNLFDLLNRSVESDPNRLAVLFENRAITYSQLMSAALRVSERLRSAGVKPGARVLMYAPNCPEFLSVYLGCAHAGAIFTPVNTAFRAREIAYVLENAGAEVAFVHAKVFDQFREHSVGARGQPQLIIKFDAADESYGTEFFGQPAGNDSMLRSSPPPAFDCPSDHGALLCYTSGTTSTPKPVLHSHGSEIYAAMAYVAAWRMERTDRGLVTLPLAWIYGLSSASLAQLTAGATIILMTHFNPERALETIEETKATIFFGSMSMYVKMLDVLERRDFTLSSLRLCTNGAEPCPDASVRAFETRTGLRLTPAYALSEARPLIAQDPEDAAAPAGTCGRLVPGAAVRILDSWGKPVATGEVGEAFIRCPGMLTAYFGEPEITQQRLSAEGWLKTGDLVSRDASGYYFVVGRTGDMIIRSGVNVAPAEIEEALLEHAGLSQAIVVGAADATSGETIVAFVVPRAGASIEEEQLREHLSVRIAQYKVPQKFVVRSNLPTNVSGKLDRAALKALAQQLNKSSTTPEAR